MSIAAPAIIGLAAGSVASTLFNKGPKAPSIADLPPAPNVAVDNQVAETERMRAEASQRVRAAGGTGRRQTLLTGAGGIPTPPPVMRKTLLGQ
jgi:hypothetical protein